MRVSINAAIFCALLTISVAASPCAAQGPTGVRVATATPAVTPAPKFKFILFWKENNAATQGMTEALKQAVAQRSQRAEWISVNVTDGAQRPIVDRYHVERAPMPMVLCIAPNGAITGGITRQLTDAAIDKALVTPMMTEATKALQDKRIAVIHVKRDPKLALPAGAAGFIADPAFKDRSTVINVSLDDAAEARFVKEMEFKPEELSDSMIVVLAPPGVLVGKYQGSVSTEQIATDLHAAGKCCNDPNCKHNKKGQ
jgi:hypothetical protein